MRDQYFVVYKCPTLLNIYRVKQNPTLFLGEIYHIKINCKMEITEKEMTTSFSSLPIDMRFFLLFAKILPVFVKHTIALRALIPTTRSEFGTVWVKTPVPVSQQIYFSKTLAFSFCFLVATSYTYQSSFGFWFWTRNGLQKVFYLFKTLFKILEISLRGILAACPTHFNSFKRPITWFA